MKIAEKLGYDRKTVTLSSPYPDGTEKIFEIETLSQGDLITILGSPIIFSVAQDGEKIEDAFKALSMEEQLDIVRKIVCTSVITPKLVLKRQRECAEDETSVYLLPMQDLMELYNAIMSFSFGEAFERVKDFFQETEG